jgi:hypothetical protein
MRFFPDLIKPSLLTFIKLISYYTLSFTPAKGPVSLGSKYLGLGSAFPWHFSSSREFFITDLSPPGACQLSAPLRFSPFPLANLAALIGFDNSTTICALESCLSRGALSINCRLLGPLLVSCWPFLGFGLRRACRGTIYDFGEIVWLVITMILLPRVPVSSATDH